MSEATVTYFYHSGFTVAVDKTLLVFDYWQGDNGELPESARLKDEDFKGFDKVFVFVSHAHPDHLDNVIYSWSKELPITYVVSDDVPIGNRGKRVKEGDTLDLDGVNIRAFGSTDLGVSFLVTVNDVKIFHAGDLNLWHWREESTLRQITQAENAFYACCAPLESEPIDVCMFPVDPRMGGMFDAGANHFIMSVKPRLFIPMHWQSRPEVAIDFARRARTKYTEVLALTKPRERAELTFNGNELRIHVFTPSLDMMPGLDIDENRKPDTEVTLDVFEGNDPFTDTDLPIKMD